jgi:hypothetical protein
MAKTALFYARICPNLNCISIMMSFLTYIRKISHKNPEHMLNYFMLGGHLGWKSGSPDTILEGGHPRTIPPKFGCNWPSGF